MGWELHPAKSAFPTFAGDWDRLNAQLYDSHPFFDSRFVGPLLEHFANGKERLCIYRTEGLVSGALILQPECMGRWSSFRPSQAQATAILLSDTSSIYTLLQTLPNFAWTIELYSVDPRYAPDFSRSKMATIIFASSHTIGIHPDLSFTEYWDKRSKNIKANIRRNFNRTKKEFLVPVLSELTEHAQMRDGVARFGELESAGWKGAAGTAVAMENSQGEFYSDVLGRFALSNQAAVYELYAGEKLASSRLVISSERMLIILKTTFDETFARFAPGWILLYQLIQKHLEKQTGKTIEFYTNATPEQMEWATFSCALQNIQLFRSDFFASAFTLLKVFQRKLRSAVSRKNSSGTSTRVDVKVSASIEAFAEDHYDLQDFAARENFENSIDWFDLLQKRVFPNDPGVRFYFVAEQNRPSTILPVRLTTKGRVRAVESLSNYYTSLYSPLLTKDSDPLDLKQILATATRDHGGAHVMRFDPMDPDSLIYKRLMSELRAIGWIPFSFFCFGNWYLKVNFDWEGYLKNRSANLRSTIKRMSKKFSAEGGTLEVVTSLTGVEQAISAFQEVYSASWKTPEPYPDFIPSLIRRLASNDMLRLGIARLNSKPIAAQLWIVGQDKASIYKVAYNEAFAAYSPGTVLTSHLLQHVIERDRVKEVDFLIGDDKYKRIWMSDRRERWGIIAYNPRTFLGFALFLKEAAGRLIKPAAKKVKNAFQTMKQRFSTPKKISP